ncbi:hypothetical protein AHAS_Ahas16G0130500 [Arachis hypogaea]
MAFAQPPAEAAARHWQPSLFRPPPRSYEKIATMSGSGLATNRGIKQNESPLYCSSSLFFLPLCGPLSISFSPPLQMQATVDLLWSAWYRYHQECYLEGWPICHRIVLSSELQPRQIAAD